MVILIHGARRLDNERTDNWLLIDTHVRRSGMGDGWSEFSSQASEVLSASGGFISAPMIETHSHGAGGHAVEDGADQIRAFVRHLRAKGVGRVIASLVSLSPERLISTVSDARTLAGQEPGFLGVHLEGPFIALEKCGAHDTSSVRPPTDDELKAVVAAGAMDGGNIIRSITLAPELFSESQLALLRDNKIQLCMGHTSSTYEQAHDFFAQGGKIVTHTFNAMKPISHKEPGPISAALENDQVFLELIADGVHVHPSAAKIIPKDRLLLVSDSMSAADLGDGEYLLGTLNVQVVESIARTATGGLAGSTLSLAKAVENYAAWTGDTRAAIAAATINPSLAYGIELPQIVDGEVAELLLFSEDGGLRRLFNLQIRNG